jgi:hypothetical protein
MISIGYGNHPGNKISMIYNKIFRTGGSGSCPDKEPGNGGWWFRPDCLKKVVFLSSQPKQILVGEARMFRSGSSSVISKSPSGVMYPTAFHEGKVIQRFPASSKAMPSGNPSSPRG